MNVKEKFFCESKKYFQGALSRKYKTNEDWNNAFDKIINDVILDTMSIYETEHFEKSNTVIRDIILDKLFKENVK